MKRFLPFLLSFILVFNISVVSVHAESPSSDWPSAFDSLDSFSSDFYTALKNFGAACYDSTQPTVRNRLKVIDTLCGSTGCGLAYMVYLKNHGSSFSDACDTVINDISQNNDGVWLADNSTATFIENFYNNNNGVKNGTGASLSQLKYTNVYIPSFQYVNPNWFSTSQEYRFFYNCIKNNPDWYFCLPSTSADWWDPYWTYTFVATKTPVYAGVHTRTDWGQPSFMCDLYNENWTQDFQHYEGDFCVISFAMSKGYEELHVSYCTGIGGPYSTWQYQTIENPSLNGLDCDDYLVANVDQGGASRAIFSNRRVYTSPDEIVKAYANDTIWDIEFHGSSVTSVPVFNSLADLKKGTIGASSSNALLPSYNVNGPNMSGVTAQQVQQADEIINNYYSPDSNDPGGGSGNGNGNGNGDNNGGSGFWGAIGEAIEGLFTVLGSLISGIVHALTDSIVSLGYFFNGIINFSDNHVVHLFSSFFEFVPDEWFSVFGLGIGVAFLIFLIRVFKG